MAKRYGDNGHSKVIGLRLLPLAAVVMSAKSPIDHALRKKRRSREAVGCSIRAWSAI